MSDLIVITGPPAVGKMTVGEALAARTGFSLLHNHVSIEVALKFFDFGSPGFSKISETIRTTIFEAVGSSDLPGLIFTWVWAFDEAPDQRYIEDLIAHWQSYAQGRVVVLELTASEAVRVVRNRHPDRLAAKASKRDVVASERLRQEHEQRHRFNSEGNFPLDLPHVLIDNTELAPDAVVDTFLRQVDWLPDAARSTEA